MNIQQLEYIVAVEHERHFVRAAERCFVTQATLSMMIKKLEEELGIKIFDRSRQPIQPTREGIQIIERAKKILAEAGKLKDFSRDLKGDVTGEIRLVVIPTLAPYLLPLFIKSFTEKFPALKITIREMITEEILKHLKDGDADIGLMATPLRDASFNKLPLFYEAFYAYASKNEKLPSKKYILPRHINPNHLWLLEEGHCMRNQAINFCALKKKEGKEALLHYEAGSIDTLIHLVDMYEGITILPQLATQWLSAAQKKKLREFAPPKPAREISLVTTQSFPRKILLNHLREEIMQSVKKNVLMDSRGMSVVDIN